MVQLLYGSGLRLMECVRPRIQDVDFEYRTITVRDGKGDKDRVVPLPETVIPEPRRQTERVCLLHEEDPAAGYGKAYLPDALARKYPNAAGEFLWQCLFPASKCFGPPQRQSEKLLWPVSSPALGPKARSETGQLLLEWHSIVCPSSSGLNND